VGDRLIALASGTTGAVLLAVLALLEATVFPGPTEAVLIALVLACRQRVWWYAILATTASVSGGVIAYFLGADLFEGVARPLLASYNMLAEVDTISRIYRDNAFGALAFSGYTPIPYMLYTMMAGAFDLPLPTFIAGSLVGRTLKYFPIAGLAYYFGPAVHRILRRVGWWAVLVVTLIVVLLLLLND
jgi:membrane protein YqaA with SNARE-associated domain